MGRHSETGDEQPFFIEYFVINPGLWNGHIIWGQSEESKKQKKKPCYAMLKVGAWGNDKVQLHNFFEISDFHASSEKLDCRIQHNILTEDRLSGEVIVSEKDRDSFPERMSDAGTMKWNLTVKKDVKFDIGYGSSRLSNYLNLFRMYWHVQGMRCAYEGEVIFKGEKYIVDRETSYGYQDKNWGRDFTNPWIWLNCNNFYSVTHQRKSDSSLDLGGGCPVVLGIPLNRRILTAFYYEGEFMEFNFSKFWKYSKQTFNSYSDEEFIYWEVVSENKNYLIDLKFSCEKSKMLLVNYENPDGNKFHNKLWNGGHAVGTLKLFKKTGREKVLIDELEGKSGGGEYGEY